mmetsp:Transcript_31056/g.66101  ORF Transcript_31056/g.66101 Transcript_31056/m.66101 type:complete len:221 (+) Transcript_31056:1-663(+)
MLNQLQNSMNSDSDGTFKVGNLNGSFNAGNVNNFTNIASPQPTQQQQHSQQHNQQVQQLEQALNISVPLKSPSDPTLKRPPSAESDSGSASRRKPNQATSGASGGNLTSSFTRAQRIGLKNSFTSGRRPNRHLNPEMAMMQQLGLKNSLMSIESLTLDDIDSADFGGGNMEGVFEDDENGSNSASGEKGKTPTRVHGQGAHDVSEVSELGFEDGNRHTSG